jgi:hypothetical protein
MNIKILLKYLSFVILAGIKQAATKTINQKVREDARNPFSRNVQTFSFSLFYG